MAPKTEDSGGLLKMEFFSILVLTIYKMTTATLSNRSNE